MEQHEEASRNLVFEGPSQETVEIVPHLDRLSVRERERGVIAGVGRARVTRQVGEGSAAGSAVSPAPAYGRDDELEAVIYQLAGYFTLAIATMILVVAVAVVVTSSVAV